MRTTGPQLRARHDRPMAMRLYVVPIRFLEKLHEHPYH